MYKTAVVNTNDLIKGRFIIGIRTFVKVPVSLRPRYVLLKSVKGRPTTRTIEITAGLDTPLELEPAESNLGGALTYRLEEVEEGRKFKVHFTSLPDAFGSFRGYLNLKTNYEEMPVVNIRINASIQNP